VVLQTLQYPAGPGFAVLCMKQIITTLEQHSVVEHKQPASDAPAIKRNAVAPKPAPPSALPERAVIITVQTLPPGHSTSQKTEPDLLLQPNAASTQRSSTSQLQLQQQQHLRQEPRPTDNAAVLSASSRPNDAQQLYDMAWTHLRGLVKGASVIVISMSFCVVLVCVLCVRRRWSYGTIFTGPVWVNSGVVTPYTFPLGPCRAEQQTLDEPHTYGVGQGTATTMPTAAQLKSAVKTFWKTGRHSSSISVELYKMMSSSFLSSFLFSPS